MAKAFRRLQKQVEGRKAFERSPNLYGRLRALEEHLFELSQHVVRAMAREPDQVTLEDASFADAAEEFKKHLELVLKEDKRNG